MATSTIDQQIAAPIDESAAPSSAPPRSLQEIVLSKRFFALLLTSLAPIVFASSLSMRAYLRWQGLGSLVPDLSAITADYLLILCAMSSVYSLTLFYPPIVFWMFDVRWSQLSRLAQGALPQHGIRQSLFQKHWIFWFFLLIFIFSALSTALVFVIAPDNVIWGLAIVMPIGAVFPVIVLFRPWLHWQDKRTRVPILAAALAAMITVIMLLPTLGLAIGASKMLEVANNDWITLWILFLSFVLFAAAYNSLVVFSDRLNSGSLSRQVAKLILIVGSVVLVSAIQAVFSGSWKIALAEAAELLKIRRTCEVILIPLDKYPESLFAHADWKSIKVGEKILKITADIPLDYGPVIVASRPRQCDQEKRQSGDVWLPIEWVALKRDDTRKLASREFVKVQ